MVRVAIHFDSAIAPYVRECNAADISGPDGDQEWTLTLGEPEDEEPAETFSFVGFRLQHWSSRRVSFIGYFLRSDALKADPCVATVTIHTS